MTLSIIQQEIQRAFNNTNPEDLQEGLKRRNPISSMLGGTFAEEQTVASLMAANWEFVGLQMKGGHMVAVYNAPISGNRGVIKIAELGDPSIELVLIDVSGQSDALKAVYVSKDSFPIKHSSLVIGADSERQKIVVWGFRPGDPDLATEVKASEIDYEHNDKITVGNAMAFGIKFVEIRTKQ